MIGDQAVAAFYGLTVTFCLVVTGGQCIMKPAGRPMPPKARSVYQLKDSLS